MQTIIRDIRVEAALDRVFDFIVDPHNWPEIWPNIVEVKSVKKSKHTEGFTFSWDYQLADMHYEGKCETIEYIPYERLVIRISKGLDGTLTWTFNSAGQSTHLTMKFDYQTPTSALKQVEEPVLLQENEQGMESALQNLKDRLELQPIHT